VAGSEEVVEAPKESGEGEPSPDEPSTTNIPEQQPSPVKRKKTKELKEKAPPKPVVSPPQFVHKYLQFHFICYSPS